MCEIAICKNNFIILKLTTIKKNKYTIQKQYSTKTSNHIINNYLQKAQPSVSDPVSDGRFKAATIGCDLGVLGREFNTIVEKGVHTMAGLFESRLTLIYD